jgi:hypothetical protein
MSVNTRVNRPQAGGYSKLRAIDVNDLALIRPFGYRLNNSSAQWIFADVIPFL